MIIGEQQTSGWHIARINDVIAPQRNALVGGPFGSNLVQRDYTASGVPVIRGQNMGWGRWVAGEFAYVSEEKSTELAANSARPGDIVFTQRGTLGQVAIVPEEPYDTYIVSQSQMKLTADRQKVDPLFIYYIFSSPEMLNYITNHAIQTGVPHTNLGILRDSPIGLPPLPEQRAIAHILGTLDDKIELNRRMSQTLEEIARALFKSWFVDFDPVRAKAAGRQPAGMDAATAALFPREFEDSELGDIPCGWHVGTIADLAEIARNSINPAQFPGETFDHYSIPAFDNGKAPVTEAGREIKSNKTSVDSNAILISKLNPHIPRVWLPDVATKRRSICSTEFLVMVPIQPASRLFVYSLLSSDPFNQTYATLVTGTTGSHQRVSPGSLLDMSLAIPPGQLMSHYAAITHPLFNRMTSNRRESLALATIRDTLLPKLLSGEFRVADREELV